MSKIFFFLLITNLVHLKVSFITFLTMVYYIPINCMGPTSEINWQTNSWLENLRFNLWFEDFYFLHFSIINLTKECVNISLAINYICLVHEHSEISAWADWGPRYRVCRPGSALAPINMMFYVCTTCWFNYFIFR